VLYVVATEVERHGQCDLYIDQIAAFAGVGRSTCRNALREAKRLGLIQVEERRLSWRYNDANRITIVSREWLVWLAHGRKETVKKSRPTYQPSLSTSRRGSANGSIRQVGGSHGPISRPPPARSAPRSESRTGSGSRRAPKWGCTRLPSRWRLVAAKPENVIRKSYAAYFTGMIRQHEAGALNLERSLWKLRRDSWKGTRH
jgi:hypothetical protein